MLFRKAFSITLATQGLMFILGMLNTILIVRAIGAEGRGVYSILLTSVSILSVLSSAGFIWSNTYWVGRERENARSVLSNGLCQAVAVLFVLLVLFQVSPGRILRVVFEGVSGKFIFYSAFLIFFELVILHLNSIFLGLQDFRRYNFLSIGRLVLFTLLNLLFLYAFGMNVGGVVYSWMISAGAALTGGLMIMIKGNDLYPFKLNLSQFLKSLRMGSRALLTNLLGQLLLRSDLFLINWYLGIKAVGYYSVGVAVAELILKVPGIAGDILFPKVAADGTSQNKNLVTRITRLMGIPLLLGALILILNGKVILSVAFGNEFIPAYNPLIWIAFGICALSYHVILDNYFAGTGYPAVMVWTPALTLALNIGLNLLLIPRYGISGAAISTCIAYFVLTAIKLRVFRKKNRVTYQEFFIINKRDLSELKMMLGWS